MGLKFMAILSLVEREKLVSPFNRCGQGHISHGDKNLGTLWATAFDALPEPLLRLLGLTFTGRGPTESTSPENF